MEKNQATEGKSIRKPRPPSEFYASPRNDYCTVSGDSSSLWLGSPSPPSLPGVFTTLHSIVNLRLTHDLAVADQHDSLCKPCLPLTTPPFPPAPI